MNSTLIESIANAVLYEGYMLYPYRPSAVKNRQRWNFGVLYPKSYSEFQNGIEPYSMQTECLIRGPESAVVSIRVRFLQAVLPEGSLQPDGNERPSQWQETIERSVTLQPASLADLLARPVKQKFSFLSRETEFTEKEPISASEPAHRACDEITGCIEIQATRCADEESLFKLTVLISNRTPAEEPHLLCREDVLLRSLLSTHTILGVTSGEFISLIDPPPNLKSIVSECKNVGTWPVLAGEENSTDAMLSSPIILYDYPQIAPESPGDLFDGTEIDEILALRILTLSEEEKREIRQGDDRAREVLERTESMPAEQFLKLHGVLRGMKPANTGNEEAPPEDQP